MSLAQLSKSIDELKPAKSFDPIRFELIESMHQRLQNARHQTNQVLIQKIQKRINEYTRDLEHSQNNANTSLTTIQVDLPAHIEQAKTLLNQSKFKQLENLLKQAKRSNKNQESLSELGNLKNQISYLGSFKQDVDSCASLDDILFNQEQRARIETGNTALPSSSSTLKFELQSTKQFRESMKDFNIDKTITRAISDFPENAGPHNPHMLVIKSLTHMRDLSPQYLRRFTRYIETILWLEKNATKLNPKKTLN